MMNLSEWRHHNIYGVCETLNESVNSSLSVARRCSEAGYTLVALLALMTLLALFALAAAPNLRQQALREREKEAIFRGEQVADAIRDYYLYKAGIGGGAGEQAPRRVLPVAVDGAEPATAGLAVCARRRGGAG